jgi:hypothetical protein
MRNMYIALGVGLGILFSGTLVFRHDETASLVVVLLTFTVGITVLHTLDARQRRREGRE